MMEEFSSGYYLRTYWVSSTMNSSSPSINETEYERISEYGYEDTPIIMKIGNRNIVVDGDENVPVQTLSVGLEFKDETDLERLPTKKEVLIPKPSVIRTLYTH